MNCLDKFNSFFKKPNKYIVTQIKYIDQHIEFFKACPREDTISLHLDFISLPHITLKFTKSEFLEQLRIQRQQLEDRLYESSNR